MVKAGELGTPLQIEANFVQDKFFRCRGQLALSAKRRPPGR